MTVDELLTALAAVKAANPDAGTWVVEADIGPVDLPVLRVDNWFGPEEGYDEGRVVLSCDR